MTKRKILSSYAKWSLSRSEVRRAVKKTLADRADLTDLERLAKVEGIGWTVVPEPDHTTEAPLLQALRRGAVFIRDDGIVMAIDGALNDSGWKACVEWLLEASALRKFEVGDRAGYIQPLVGDTIHFSTPGKPTDDELIQAVLEVSGQA